MGSVVFMDIEGIEVQIQGYGMPGHMSIAVWATPDLPGHIVEKAQRYIQDNREEVDFALNPHLVDTCAYCGKKGYDMARDHVVPRCQGGGDNEENIVMACKSCNSKKKGRTPEEANMPILYGRDRRKK